jgi:hypothetical protein
MQYPENFLKVLDLNTFIGTGNPNSKILIVGKEVATDPENGKDAELEKINLEAFNRNSLDWKSNVEKSLSIESIEDWSISNENNPLYAFKGIIIKKQGHTWNKYQKLNNYIFDKLNNKELNFQEDFFITEMSDLPSKTTGLAQRKKEFKEKLKHRKESLFKTEFIQNFPIVVLACSNYINGEEICDIFNVNYIEEKGIPRQKFWIHSNSDKSKLVIHTRNLSTDVSDKLLNDIAFEIKTFLKQV